MADGLWVPTQVKKGKDPNAPKRPMSAYMLWLNASREKIKSDHPGISVTDLSKKAGEIWKGMSKEKKEVRSRGQAASGPWDLMEAGGPRAVVLCWFCLHRGRGLIYIYIYFPVFFIPCVCVTQEWDRKAEDARREYEKAMKEYEGGRGESSKR